jgi:hypothetical protein
MATFFRNKIVKEVGTVPILVFGTNSNTRATVIGISLANLTEVPVYASILVADDTSQQGYFLKDVMIPANTSLKALSAGEKLILAPDNQMYIVADQDEAFDALVSYVDIT